MKNRNRMLGAILAVLACFAVLSHMQAQVPDGCYPAFNTKEGCNALFKIPPGTGVGNTAVGWFSLWNDMPGSYNTGVGAGTPVLNIASSNTAAGAAALLLNGTGTQNCAFGTDALVFNGFGVLGANFNNAFGAFALYNNSSGFSNNAVGNHALFQNIDGAGNTAVGDQALFANVSGSHNTAIGALAGSLVSGSDNIDIGQGVFGLATDNAVTRIGIGVSGTPVLNPAVPACFIDGILQNPVGFIPGFAGEVTINLTTGQLYVDIVGPARQAMLNDKVQELEAKVAQQHSKIDNQQASIAELK